jgi:hypothetical protein
MEDDGDFDTGSDAGDDTAAPEDTSSRSDVEESVIAQKTAKGDPDPRRAGDRRIVGRPDSAVGGRYEYSQLDRYHDEAVKNGTTLDRAVGDYVAVETELRKNPVAGLTYLATRLNVNPQQLAAAWYQAVHGQNGNAYTQQAAAQAEYSRHVNDIASFAAKNPHFEHVRQDMARIVQSGRANNLKDAYRLAINANPQLRAQAKMERSYARTEADMARARH